MNTFDYSDFSRGPAARQWAALGARRRAGVCAPLFSLHSSRSVGIGEIPDLGLLIDWCVLTGQSLLQLLPLNDVGYDFAPYSAKSSFALDPMYLSLRDLIGVDTRAFAGAIDGLARLFPRGKRVNYGVKGAKVSLLWDLFRRADKSLPAFERFRAAQRYWLRDDALYKVLKGRFQGRGWEEWDEPFRWRHPAALEQLAKDEADALLFQEWLQWQLFEQFRAVKRHAGARGVFIMGDLPFLVARDSADVWAHPDYFKLDLSSGAPPDLYFAGGQRWGMPPYRWDAMAARDHDYLVEKLRYAENFYHLYRIDHVIGVFRLYTIPLSAPAERGGLDGTFDPPDERQWEDHGTRLLRVMLNATSMLPCGEDLGVVPACSNPTLARLGIPGLDVQRWARDWGTTYDFRDPAQNRKNACAVVSTHDMSNVSAWWEEEAGTVDDYFFRLKCAERRMDADGLRRRLFDAEPAAPGRLRWNPHLRDVPALVRKLERREEDVRDFIDLFLGSHDEKERFWRRLGGAGPAPQKATPAFVRNALESAGRSAAVFSVQLIFDWLSVDRPLPGRPGDYRVNYPGSVGPHNWSVLCPLSLDDHRRWPGNSIIADINRSTDRWPAAR